MASRTAEEVRMENKILRKILFPCKACGGLGKLDDSAAGDIFFNTWECPSCEGFNARLAKEELEAANG